MNALNTINGFTITERAIASQALNYKLSQYREYLAKSVDPAYADIKVDLDKRLKQIEASLIVGKALVK